MLAEEVEARMAALEGEVLRLGTENAQLRSENEALRQGRQGPISVVVRRMSGEEAATLELDGLGTSVADLMQRISQQTGVAALSQRLYTAEGVQLSSQPRPPLLADAFSGAPAGQRIELTLAVTQPMWHASEAFSLSEDAILATRVRPTDGMWAVLRSTVAISPEGASELTLQIVNDPSDGCWMLGVLAAGASPVSFLPDSHAAAHPGYEGALLYRSDNGDVWVDGAKQRRVEASGRSTGQVAKVRLERRAAANGASDTLTISGTSRSGRDIQISTGGFLQASELQFVVLTYRVDSAFSFVEPA